MARHHWLVRVTHWGNIPILLGLGLSGLSIYWAAPVFKHSYNQATGSDEYLADTGIWAVNHLPFQKTYAHPEEWFYNHFSLGPHLLAQALNLHWLFAYLFMAIGVLYIAGLVLGKGYKALLPKKTDIRGVFLMVRYYTGLIPMRLMRRKWEHPVVDGKYNALQKLAYLSMPVFGMLAVLSGWAIHKPQQLSWLQALFGGYDTARIWHFAIMWVFVAFVIPHVILVIADGWATFRSMVTGRTIHES